MIGVKNILSGDKLNKLKNAAKVGVSKVTTSAQAGMLKLKGKNADEAFLLLKLDKAGDDLLSSPQFPVWVSFMAKTNKKHPKTAIVSNLASRYGDDTLARMLETAKKAPGTTQIATKLQVAQMRDWLRRETSMDDVLALLKLDDGVDKVLTNPALDTLGVYINQFNKFHKLNPDKQTTTIDTLMVQYGDDAVAKMLEAAKKEPGTEKLAKDLQVAQFAQWLKEGAKPANIWKMLKMEKATWMTNSDADVWRGYLAFYKAHKSTATLPTP